MSTKFDRLVSTVAVAHETWRTEQAFCEPNATNESAFSVQVIEPILTALEWPRLRREEMNETGAYFEWPRKHQVDVALLERGQPKAFFELKQTHPGCREDLNVKLERHPELRAATYAVAAWFLGNAGFSFTGSGKPRVPTQLATISLADASHDPRALAVLAAPVLQSRAPDPNTWLQLPSPDVEPVRARMRPRDVQTCFFALIQHKLNLAAPVQTRRSFSRQEPPTPTFAFTELPGVLPRGWGLVLDIDPTMNKVNCFFYRMSSRKIEEVGRSFDGSRLDESTLTSFLEESVLPVIERWRREAKATGMR